MKPVYQTRDGYPDGNCTEACVASILEIELDDVPAIRKMDYTWIDELNDFLSQYGLYALGVVYNSHEDMRPHGWHCIGGKSTRGLGHMVVGYNGQVVHDPHPGQCGLETLEDNIIFVSLDPSKSVPKRVERPGMKQGYKYEDCLCVLCHKYVKANWMVAHLRSECAVGNPREEPDIR